MGGVIGKLSRLSLSEDLRSPGLSGGAGLAAEPCPPASCDTPQRKLALVDPRSVTIGIKRTPIIITKDKGTKEENDTPVKPKPYLETDLDEALEAEESTAVIEHESDSLLTPENPLSEDLKEPTCDVSDEEGEGEVISNVEEPVPNGPESESSDLEIISVEGKILNSPALSKTKKAPLIFEDNTPVSESTPVKPKSGRTPLGLVSHNSSPIRSSSLAGRKPWRGFHEERVRLGLENTPPNAGPFIESVQSAPGKVAVRKTTKKLTRANWALDESLII